MLANATTGYYTNYQGEGLQTNFPTSQPTYTPVTLSNDHIKTRVGLLNLVMEMRAKAPTLDDYSDEIRSLKSAIATRPTGTALTAEPSSVHYTLQTSQPVLPQTNGGPLPGTQVVGTGNPTPVVDTYTPMSGLYNSPATNYCPLPNLNPTLKIVDRSPPHPAPVPEYYQTPTYFPAPTCNPTLRIVDSSPTPNPAPQSPAPTCNPTLRIVDSSPTTQSPAPTCNPTLRIVDRNPTLRIMDPPKPCEVTRVVTAKLTRKQRINQMRSEMVPKSNPRLSDCLDLSYGRSKRRITRDFIKGKRPSSWKWDGTYCGTYSRGEFERVTDSRFPYLYRYYIRDGEYYEFQMHDTKNAWPCIADKIGELFGLSSQGTHWALVGGEAKILYYIGAKTTKLTHTEIREPEVKKNSKFIHMMQMSITHMLVVCYEKISKGSFIVGENGVPMGHCSQNDLKGYKMDLDTGYPKFKHLDTSGSLVKTYMSKIGNRNYFHDRVRETVLFNGGLNVFMTRVNEIISDIDCNLQFMSHIVQHNMLELSQGLCSCFHEIPDDFSCSCVTVRDEDCICGGDSYTCDCGGLPNVSVSRNIVFGKFDVNQDPKIPDEEMTDEDYLAKMVDLINDPRRVKIPNNFIKLDFLDGNEIQLTLMSKDKSSVTLKAAISRGQSSVFQLSTVGNRLDGALTMKQMGSGNRMPTTVRCEVDTSTSTTLVEPPPGNKPVYASKARRPNRARKTPESRTSSNESPADEMVTNNHHHRREERSEESETHGRWGTRGENYNETTDNETTDNETTDNETTDNETTDSEIDSEIIDNETSDEEETEEERRLQAMAQAYQKIMNNSIKNGRMIGGLTAALSCLDGNEYAAKIAIMSWGTTADDRPADLVRSDEEWLREQFPHYHTLLMSRTNEERQVKLDANIADNIRNGSIVPNDGSYPREQKRAAAPVVKSRRNSKRAAATRLIMRRDIRVLPELMR